MKLLTLLFFLPHLSIGMDTTWWKHTIVYEIFVWSFKDSNGDGNGDIAGIIQKLDHIVESKIETIYLSPFFKSPLSDMGYDVSNYTAVEPLLGTMQDFERLVDAANQRGLKLIADFVINHSSDEHPWFQKSIDREDPYTDYYVWVDPKGYDAKGNPIPPNNWMSIFGGSAWEWNSKRQQFYLHQFTTKQPDFNLRNERVKKEIQDIVKFWLNKGISGFRIDAAKFFFEDELLRDEPTVDPNKKQATDYNDLRHIYTHDLWDCYVFLHNISLFIKDYSIKNNYNHQRILIVESYTGLNETMAYYGTRDYPVAQFPFNFGFARLDSAVPAMEFDHIINHWLQSMPLGATANWVAENHDRSRIGSRLGEQYMDIILTAQMTLPGVACLYYGQEIGMQNYVVREDQRQDPNVDLEINVTRDGERLPMQWDSSINAGYSSSNKLYLPLNPDYWRVNVETQKNTNHSRYNTFKMLASLRKSKTMKHGHFRSHILSKWVYSFVRSYKNYRPYIVIFNLGTETEFFYLHDAIPNIPSNLEVVSASLNAGYRAGDTIRSTPKFPGMFAMRPISAVVLTRASRRQPNQYLIGRRT